MTRVTVLGSSGFIGSRLVGALASLGRTPFTPGRSDDLTGLDLGDVVYCIGFTSDNLLDPRAAVEAHVGRLARLLSESRLRSLLYLSTARVYRPSTDEVREDDDLVLNPVEPADFYPFTKVLGEALALTSPARVRIARLSHVYSLDGGSPRFLVPIVRDAVAGGVELRSSLDSTKDFIRVDDVVAALIAIMERGSDRIYNVASGHLVTHRELMARLVELTGCRVRVAPDAPTPHYPRINVERLRELTGGPDADILTDLAQLVHRQQGEAPSIPGVGRQR